MNKSSVVSPIVIDPRLCCAAQICCDNPEDALEALTTLLAELAENTVGDRIARKIAEDLAAWIFANFDLIPKGAATALYKHLRSWFDQAKENHSA